MRIALAGNANAGKTTLFNALCGSEKHVGNYGGVTVQAADAPLRAPRGANAPSGPAPTLIDLPGALSLTARSPDERATQAVLLGENGRQCDAVLAVVDACQLGRGLYFCLQLMELGWPMVVAVHRVDAARRRGIAVDTEALGRLLGVPALACAARTGEGLDALRDALWALRCAHPTEPPVREPAPEPPTPNEQQAQADLLAALHAHAHFDVPRPAAVAQWLLGHDKGGEPVPLGAAAQQALHAARRLAMAHSAMPSLGRRRIAARFATVDALVHAVVRTTHSGLAASVRLDRWLLHPVVGAATLLLALFATFQLAFAAAEPAVDAIEALTQGVQHALHTTLPPGLWRSLLTDGVLAGCGNVLGFVPQIALLFFALGLLEESGYMARAALLLDRAMQGVGLSGRSFIPLMSSFGCAIPGIMATRTIADRGQALRTMLVAPLMSCSARLPAYTLVIGAVFSAAPPLYGVISVGGVIIFALYVLGFVAALGTAKLLQLVWPGPKRPRALILELPDYAWPRPLFVARAAARRAWQFVRGGGPTILGLSVVLWALMTFPRGTPPSADELLARHEPIAVAAAEHPVPLEARAEAALRAWHLEHSFAGRLGHAIEPALRPLGLDWRIGIGLVASIAAREVLVSTLAQVFALGDTEQDGEPVGLRQALTHERRADGRPRFGVWEGVSLLVFFVLALQCLSTVAILRRESGGWRWPLAALVYMNGLAYAASFVAYQSGRYVWPC